MDNRQREMIHILMNQHSKPMVQAAYRRIGDWHLAEDLVQETFLTACWKANQICSHSNPTASTGLSEQDKELILLRIDKKLSFDEIAEYYGITNDACRQRLSRAIRKCRSLLDCEK